MYREGFLRRRINKRLKLVQIPYRVYPKDFGKNAGKKAVDELRESLEMDCIKSE